MIVYGLTDPRDPKQQVKYVGITNNMARRLEQHVKDAQETEKRKWIRDLLEAGLSPSFVLLQDKFSNELPEQAELRWIQELRKEGKLFNTTGNKIKTVENSDLREPMPTDFAGIERKAIIEALLQHHGNKLQVAKQLGIGRQTLYNKLKLYGISLVSNPTANSCNDNQVANDNALE